MLGFLQKIPFNQLQILDCQTEPCKTTVKLIFRNFSIKDSVITPCIAPQIKDEELIEKIVEIQNRMFTISCVPPFPKGYFHISVAGLGFLTESEEYEDDILIESLQKTINQAGEVLQQFSKFEVLLSKLNIFPDVVFVEVHDESRIEEIFRRLQSIPEIRSRKLGYPSFLPHISIMHFQKNENFTRLISCLGKLRSTEFGRMTVNSIELVDAHLSQEYPKLNTIHTFDLKQQL